MYDMPEVESDVSGLLSGMSGMRGTGEVEPVGAHGAVLARASFESGLWVYFFWSITILSIVTVMGLVFLPFWICFGPSISKQLAGTYELTLHERVLVSKQGGVCGNCCARIEKTILLDRIQDLTITQDCLEKCTNLCTLQVQTAGSSAPQGPELAIPGIRDPHVFRDLVLTQRHRYVGSGPASDGLGVGTAPGGLSDPGIRSEQLSQALEPLAELLVQIKTILEKKNTV